MITTMLLVAAINTADVSRPPREFRAVTAGPPPAEWCSDDDRDAGRAVIDLNAGCLWVCMGEGKGWVCK